MEIEPTTFSLLSHFPKSSHVEHDQHLFLHMQTSFSLQTKFSFTKHEHTKKTNKHAAVHMSREL